MRNIQLQEKKDEINGIRILKQELQKLNEITNLKKNNELTITNTPY